MLVLRKLIRCKYSLSILTLALRSVSGQGLLSESLTNNYRGVIRTLFLASFLIFASYLPPVNALTNYSTKSKVTIKESSRQQVALAEQLKQINPIKIEFNTPQLGRRIAISLHHAVLESDIKNGYIIAELTEQEINKLKERGISLRPATKWKTQQMSRLASIDTQRHEYFAMSKGAYQGSNGSMMEGIDGYECYQTVEETFLEAQNLATEYSDLAEWIDIGDSWQKADNTNNGYDLWVLKITNKQVAGPKPILFVQSSMHAREYTPAALTLDFAKALLTEYSTNADYQWVVDHREIHLLLQMNPDGRKIAENQIFQRKNTNQNHCPTNKVGVDLNRNFAQTWGTVPGGSSSYSCDETYRGATAESEPETQAVSNYIRNLFEDKRGPLDSDAAPADTSGMHLDIHSYSELVLWPYGHTEVAAPNANAFEVLGSKFAWFNDYTPMQSVGLYPTDGTSDNVSYGELGVAAFTFELGTQFFQSCNQYLQEIKPDNIRALVYAAKVSDAPYLTPAGPEIDPILVNGLQGIATVPASSPVQIVVEAHADNTKQAVDADRYVQKVEYSVNEPIWNVSAEKQLIFEANSQPQLSQLIDFEFSTVGLSMGKHKLYFQATNSAGQKGAVSAALIEISDNQAPIGSFSFTCNDLDCSFDGTNSVDNDGQIVMYEWQFGDGNTGLGASISHTYAQEGSYAVQLKITDNLGAIHTTSQQVNVQSATSVDDDDPVFLPTPDKSSGGGGLGLLLVISSLLLVSKRHYRL